MADGEAGIDAVVDVVELPSGRRRRIGVIVAGVLVPALVAGSVWAFGSSGDRHIALVPQSTDAGAAAEPPALTETPPVETIAPTIESTTAVTEPAAVPTEPPSLPAGHPGTVKPDNSGGCVGDQPKVFVPLIMPSFTGTDLHGWIAGQQKFMWDGVCTHQPMSWEFQSVNGDCAPSTGLVGKAYAQSPSPGAPFELGAIRVTLTVYVDCNAPPPPTNPFPLNPPPPIPPLPIPAPPPPPPPVT
jgi:hypothetical protein